MSIWTEALRQCAAMSIGLGGAYLLGLGAFWLDVALLSNRLRRALPESVSSAVDVLYGPFFQSESGLHLHLF